MTCSCILKVIPHCDWQSAEAGPTFDSQIQTLIHQRQVAWCFLLIVRNAGTSWDLQQFITDKGRHGQYLQTSSEGWCASVQSKLWPSS